MLLCFHDTINALCDVLALTSVTQTANFVMTFAACYFTLSSFNA